MGDSTIIAENKNELLGILDKLSAILDLKLSFENHIKNLCKKDVKHSTHWQKMFHTCVLEEGEKL